MPGRCEGDFVAGDTRPASERCATPRPCPVDFHAPMKLGAKHFICFASDNIASSTTEIAYRYPLPFSRSLQRAALVKACGQAVDANIGAVISAIFARPNAEIEHFRARFVSIISPAHTSFILAHTDMMAYRPRAIVYRVSLFR